jgi:hypothetical protein
MSSEAEVSRRRKSQSNTVGVYDYQDAEGRILYQVVRYQSGRIAHRRPDGRGGWTRGLKSARRVPFRLPELLAASEGTAIYIAKDERDVEALVSIGVVATCSADGYAKFTSDLKLPFKGMSVVIIATKNQADRRHARQVARIVSSVAASVRVVELPGGIVNQVCDWVATGGTREALEYLADEAADWTLDQPSAGGQGDKGQLPQIVVNERHLRNIADDSWRALQQANDPPVIFQRGHLPVDIILDDRGQPVMRTLDKSAFKGLLDRRADYVSVGDDGVKPARPPTDVVADMMAAKELPLPMLLGIVESPIYSPTGGLSTAAGYQPETHFYLHLKDSTNIPEVPEQPDGSLVYQARSLILDDLLVDFCFVDESDRANAVAALLLPFVRLLIQGPTPLHLVESPSPGSGKGLLVDALAMPATGRKPPIMTEGRDDEEWRKRVTAKLLQGPQFILIDNLRSRLDSAALSAALTSEVWEDRILGQSRTAQIPVTCVWLATANNPALSLEVARRTISIRLDSQVERPWLRSDFKHRPLLRWARENRGQLIWAALTLVRNWIVAGKPAGKQSLGSYESWAEVTGGILEEAGIQGFLCNMDRIYSEVDQEVLGWAELCASWWEKFGTSKVTAEQLLKLAADRSLLHEYWDSRDERGARVSFGKALSGMRDRVVSSFCIRRVGWDSHNKVVAYRLEQVSAEKPNPTTAGDAGDCGGFSGSEKSSRHEKHAGDAMGNETKTRTTKSENYWGEKSPAITRITRNDPWDQFLGEEE